MERIVSLKNLRRAALAGAALSLLAACGGGNSASEAQADASSTQSSAPAGAQSQASAELGGANILVFSRTAGWRHRSIEAGQEMFRELADQYGFEVTITEDPTVFSDAQIGAFDTVVFLNTTGDVLNDRQERAFERYIQSGGGYVGIHAASDTEHDGNWPWYVGLVGGTFKAHPGNPSNVQRARLTKANDVGKPGESLPQAFDYIDEWYDFNNLDTTTTPVLFIDRDSYVGAVAEGEERISWLHEYDGGRVFYTNLGHKDGTFQDDLFKDHIIDGLVYAVGDRQRTPLLTGRPDPDRFEKQVLTSPLDEPVSLDIMPDGSVFIVERPGRIKLWREGEGIEVVGEVSGVSELLTSEMVAGNSEFGLLAMAAVPHDRVAPVEGAYVMYNTLVDNTINQRVAYVPYTDGEFDFENERRLFDMPNDPNCCHTGGAVEFGPDGYLYIATGDNSNPHGIAGLSPISDDPDDLAHDARRSAGNTMDLRGKILRIDPSPDGSYEIPEGNLFTDEEEGRPEIYVMGTRNPYTIGFDAKEGTLFYGDVGPDGRENTPQGPQGYDEINRVAEAGNFGWPFFVGDNYPYLLSPPGENGGPGRLQNPQAPINESARNDGARELPPANPALIWYPYGESERFPEMGTGGRNALVAGVYHMPQTRQDGAWPVFFQDKLIISDFMRRYLRAVEINEAGRVERITPIAEGMLLSGPLDMDFGPDGALYVLEYGTRWFSGNEDAGLSRVVFTGTGNRAPELTVNLDRHAGSLPLTVAATTGEAFDPDGDQYTVEWAVVPVPEGTDPSRYASLFDDVVSEGEQAELTIDEPGRHLVMARATDAKGAKSFAWQPVDSGNERPVVSIAIEGNQSFFWPGRQSINYSVSVADAEDGSSEDGSISAEAIDVRATKAMTTAPAAAAPMGHLEAAAASGADSLEADATALLQDNACMSCHQIDASSVGPAYTRVAERYAGDEDAKAKIDQSIAEGGSGKWGEVAMPAYGFLDAEVRGTIADYILSLHDGSTPLQTAGSISARDFIADPKEYVLLSASYTDQGADGAPALSNSAVAHLRSNVLDLASLYDEDAEDTGVSSVNYGGQDILIMSGGGSQLYLGEYDLTDIGAVNVGWSFSSQYMTTGRMRVELRQGGADGEVIAVAPLETREDSGQQTGTLPLDFESQLQGMHDLYLRVVPMPGSSEDAQVVFTTAEFEPEAAR